MFICVPSVETTTGLMHIAGSHAVKSQTEVLFPWASHLNYTLLLMGERKKKRDPVAGYLTAL